MRIQESLQGSADRKGSDSVARCSKRNDGDDHEKAGGRDARLKDSVDLDGLSSFYLP